MNISELRELLVEELQDLLNAENQIVGALPKMVDAANNDKLKEAFEKHLLQTKGHVERLTSALQLLGESAQSKPCKGMKGLLEEGEETIKDGEEQDELTADPALIAAAQKVEHYEISGYGTARCLARQLGEREVATLSVANARRRGVGRLPPYRNHEAAVAGSNLRRIRKRNEDAVGRTRRHR
jgi:Mn-containing catalase